MAYRARSSKRAFLVNNFTKMVSRKCCYPPLYVISFSVIFLQIFLCILLLRQNDKLQDHTCELVASELTRRGANDEADIDPGRVHWFAETQNFELHYPCDIKEADPLSAINRAKSARCKQLIINTTCAKRSNRIYPTSLPRSCPSKGFVYGKYLGCFRDSFDARLLNDGFQNFGDENSHARCLDACQHAGFVYAGVQYGKECFCGYDAPVSTLRLEETACNMSCPANPSENCGGSLTMNIFETGIALHEPPTVRDLPTDSLTTIKPIRIAFLLVLNGRHVRQVYRLLKAIYHKDYFYLIHVDHRNDYMFLKLLPLEEKLPNVRLVRKRFATIWAGASLHAMYLSCLSELIHSSWDWEFMINLSESDFPIQSMEKLGKFLSINRDINFVGWSGRNRNNFRHNALLDHTFVECDYHMWLIGKRTLPKGIVVQGGSDWYVLPRNFINFLVTTKGDTFLEGIKKIFRHTLMSAESFMYTALFNTIYCNTLVNENLRFINWNHTRGCGCDVRKVVDWCGCRPIVLRMNDWHLIESQNQRKYFARKFDPVICQTILTKLEERLGIRNADEFESERRYWLNLYHHADREPDDRAHMTVYASLARRAITRLGEKNPACSNAEFTKILQVFSLHEEDRKSEVLVHFQTTYSRSKMRIEFEARYEIRSTFELYSFENTSRRFEHLEVNTDFDIREFISRNYAGAMGPNSEVQLIYKVVNGTPVPNISVFWIDPTQKLRNTGRISLGDDFGVYHSPANMERPLMPGKWEVYLSTESQILARVQFAIVPTGEESLKSQLKVNNSEEMLPIIGVMMERYTPEIENKKWMENMTSSDRMREKWIDDMTEMFYRVTDLCIVDRDTSCYSNSIPLCSKTTWSSFSPDPKSQIEKID